ncbi:uncharacterized protein LOC131035085 isoform X1 [Cryptomeria japonica]|uniref:uncharacterized protein LOC131035085 isoform X1 n=1 Tax=Cryptomeria japonica TaxID=3369 RepID=UPI0025AD298B|nr:uncharacterized protein LOC131035085 isoform X1 [Cryptomeria japonica]XP_057822698.1 uncharacterized protein LOC131035085 isoform X1 [Cryptomeria japonica]
MASSVYCHWSKINCDPCNCNCMLGSDCNSSPQRSVRRKLEGLNLKCNNSCISARDDGGSTAEEGIVSKDVTDCTHCYQQWNDSTKEIIEESRKLIYFGELPKTLISEISTEQVNGRSCFSLTLHEENEGFDSLHSSLHYSSPAHIDDRFSSKKVLVMKKNAPGNVPVEAESHIHMMEVEKEAHTLREALRGQHYALQDLYTELEEERNASSTAANEALSMILRLQDEKAAVRLEANQYKRMAEEKIAHDQESLAFFEEIIYRKDKEIDALEYEIQAYRHRLLSIGFDDLEIGKIRYLERSYSNDNTNARYGGCDNWINSEQECSGSHVTLGWKTSNNTHSRDLWKIQDKKGKRCICKNDHTCLDDTWNEGTNAFGSGLPQNQQGVSCSEGVTHGQDRASGNSNRIQLEGNSVSRNVIKESIRVFSNNRSDNYARQITEIDWKLQQGFKDTEVEPDFTTQRFKVQDPVHEIGMNTPELSPRGNSFTLWEDIEKLEDQLQQLSKRRGLNCCVEEEWASTSRELQKTVAAYTASLREGARSHWRLPLDNIFMCDGLIKDTGVQSTGDPRLSNICEKGKENVKLPKANSQVLFSEINPSNLKAAGNESDSSFNIHDVYVIQNEYERNGEVMSDKAHALNLDLEDGDRLGKPDPLPQNFFLDPSSTARNSLPSSSHNAHEFNVSTSLCNALSVVPVESMLEFSSVQEDVRHINTRLQALEENGEFVKQAIDSLKRDREELSLLKEIAQQLRELKEPLKSCKDVKSSPPHEEQEDASVVRFMEVLQGNVSITRYTNKKDDGSSINEGLVHLLEKTPLRRMSSHITRTVKIISFTDVGSGHIQGK